MKKILIVCRRDRFASPRHTDPPIFLTIHGVLNLHSLQIYMNKYSKTFAGIALAAVVVMTGAQIADAATLTRQLELGVSGTDVSTLQTFLAQDNTIYPQGLVTGYFGGLTKSAVSNFQVRNNLPSVGRVGPMTLAVINAQMAGGTATGDINAPIIWGVSVSTSASSAIVNWSTNEFSKGIVYYSTSPLVLGEHATYVDISGMTAMTDTTLRSTQSVSITGLMPNTTYYYSAHTTDSAGNISITWPQAFRTSN